MDALRDGPTKNETAILSNVVDNKEVSGNIEKPFTQQGLTEAWKGFVEKIDDAPQLKSALGTREPILTNKWQVQYELDSGLQLDRLTLDIKPKLLGYLRSLFGNEAIEVHFKVSANIVQQPNVPYTEAERWESLVEKFPALAVLKTKFGLDFEHL